MGGYDPNWTKWKIRRLHARWAVAGFFHNIGYWIAGDT